MSRGAAITLFTCVGCGGPFSECSECVFVVEIDPVTGIPPDVVMIDGNPVVIEPTAEAKARSQKQPLCDNCVKYRNGQYPTAKPWELAPDRHLRAHL